MADLEKRLAKLEKDVAKIMRLRIVATNLIAQESEDEANGKAMRPQADKAVRLRDDK